MSDADSTQLESRGSGSAQILNKQKGPFRGLFLVGGEGGVRTHVGLTPPTDFESKIKYSNLILINMLRPLLTPALNILCHPGETLRLIMNLY